MQLLRWRPLHVFPFYCSSRSKGMRWTMECAFRGGHSEGEAGTVFFPFLFFFLSMRYLANMKAELTWSCHECCVHCSLAHLFVFIRRVRLPLLFHIAKCEPLPSPLTSFYVIVNRVSFFFFGWYALPPLITCRSRSHTQRPVLTHTNLCRCAKRDLRGAFFQLYFLDFLSLLSHPSCSFYFSCHCWFVIKSPFLFFFILLFWSLFYFALFSL